MIKPKIVVTIGQMHYPRMINADAMADLSKYAEVVHHTGQRPARKEELTQLLADADACLTSWEVAPLDADVIAAAPRLKALAHMGGSVKKLVSPA